LKTDGELLPMTDAGREFQTDGALKRTFCEVSTSEQLDEQWRSLAVERSVRVLTRWLMFNLHVYCVAFITRAFSMWFLPLKCPMLCRVGC